MKALKLRAEVHEKGWREVDVIISDREIVFEKNAIPLKEIEDIEIVQIDGKEAIRIKKEVDFYFNFKEKQRSVFRYLAFNLKSDRFAVYFLSPAFRGGVFVNTSKWEKGYLSVTERAIWFLSPTKQLRIPIDAIGSVKGDIRTVGKKERRVLAVTHIDGGEVVVSFVLCPETTLEMLQEYLRKIINLQKPKEKLSEIEEQVLQMVYTGVDSSNIESILGISTDELNAIYDKLISLGLVRVVKVRKEVELTPKGVAIVSELVEKVSRGG